MGRTQSLREELGGRGGQGVYVRVWCICVYVYICGAYVCMWFVCEIYVCMNVGGVCDMYVYACGGMCVCSVCDICVYV